MLESSLLNIFLLSLVLGIATGIWSIILDFLMDYGHLFGKIRLSKAKKLALNLTKQADREEILTGLDAVENGNDSWTDRIEESAEIYNRIAGLCYSFRIYICPYCLGLRLAVIMLFLWVPLVEILFDFDNMGTFISYSVNLFILLPTTFLTIKLIP